MKCDGFKSRPKKKTTLSSRKTCQWWFGFSDDGDSRQKRRTHQIFLNHASFVHSEDGEVYYDGLRVDLHFLLRAFYFSKPTTLIFLRSTQEEKMADEEKSIPCGYFLTDYERDLLRLPIEDALWKYLRITCEQMEFDLVKIQDNQASFVQDNGQN